MPKRILQGNVTSDKNEQTITVQVERRFTHPVLKKTIRSSKKYRAHDESNIFKVGDMVRIQECAPKSKSKRWLTQKSAPNFARSCIFWDEVESRNCIAAASNNSRGWGSNVKTAGREDISVAT